MINRRQMFSTLAIPFVGMPAIASDKSPIKSIGPYIKFEDPIDLFTRERYFSGDAAEYKLPKESIAHSIPNQGNLPCRYQNSDYIMVPYYEIGSHVDIDNEYKRQRRNNLIQRQIKLLDISINNKLNLDSVRLLEAAADKNKFSTTKRQSKGDLTSFIQDKLGPYTRFTNFVRGKQWYVIGVSKTYQNLFFPVREELEIKELENPPLGRFGYSAKIRFGLCCLNSDYVISGPVLEDLTK